MTDNIFQHTKRICMELSNRCPWARFHARCPLHNERARPTTILPAKIVYHVLDACAAHEYAGMVYFHMFNEPLIDPRLFQFIRYARAYCPQIYIHITTNGWYLDQTLLDELTEAGVNRVRISCYNETEYARLRSLRHAGIDFVPFRQHALMPEVLRAYDAPETGSRQRCYAPLQEINISRDGDVTLCCTDWRRDYKFGSLHTETLEQILRSEPVQTTYARLSRGDRFLPLCKRCHWAK